MEKKEMNFNNYENLLKDFYKKLIEMPKSEYKDNFMKVYYEMDRLYKEEKY